MLPRTGTSSAKQVRICFTFGIWIVLLQFLHGSEECRKVWKEALERFTVNLETRQFLDILPIAALLEKSKDSGRLV